MSEDFDRHLETLYACRLCATVAGRPITGAVRGANVIIVGQAPGPRESESGRPFAHTAGRRLFGWLADATGADENRIRERVYIAAVARCFPGRTADGRADRAPSGLEIANCRRHLDREIEILRPELIIAVGSLASSELVGDPALARAVGRIHRIHRGLSTLDVVVLPHPSGRSTWLNEPANRTLLQRSLELIARHPAVHSTLRA